MNFFKRVLLDMVLLIICKTSHTASVTCSSCSFKDVKSHPTSATVGYDKILDCCHSCCKQGCSYVAAAEGQCHLFYSYGIPVASNNARLYRRTSLPVCHTNWALYGDSCFHVVKKSTAMTSPAAASECAAFDNGLARLGVWHSHPVSVLVNWLKNCTGYPYMWIGANWNGTAMVWADGTYLPPDHAYWDPVTLSPQSDYYSSYEPRVLFYGIGFHDTSVAFLISATCVKSSYGNEHDENKLSVGLRMQFHRQLSEEPGAKHA